MGTACGRVRALLSDSGEKINEAEPSTPVEILGLTEVPQAGENFEVVANEKEMKAIIFLRLYCTFFWSEVCIVHDAGMTGSFDLSNDIMLCICWFISILSKLLV